MNEVARRYALALFGLAQEKDVVEKVHAGTQAFGRAIEASADLRRFLNAPLYKFDDKASALTALAEKMGLGPLVVKFIGTMALNGRANDLAAAIGAYDELYVKQRGIKRAVVRTAAAMNPAQRERLQGLLARVVGGEVQLNEEVDEGLIGGIQLRIGSQLVDSSLRAKLERLNTAMKGA